LEKFDIIKIEGLVKTLMFLLAFLLEGLVVILFSCTKKQFVQYVNDKTISNHVYDAYKKVFHQKTKLSQIKSWSNSLPFLKDILEMMPDNTGITIEYNIPLTSKRIDVVISGYDITHRPVLILLELKQWEYAKKVKNQDACVRTLIGKSEKNCLHPAYQVLSYKELLQNYNLNIEAKEIKIIPLVYLHNYDLKLTDDLYDKKYFPYYQKVSMFGKEDVEELKYFLENNLCFGDNLKVINMIDESKLKPTKKLTDVIQYMIHSKKEFTLLDEQKVVMEEITKQVFASFTDHKKRVLIIKGGPGTGKSVLALNALGELLSLGLVGAYTSKNMAPRKVYQHMLSNRDSELNVRELFKSSGYFFRDSDNKYDFLLVDEAHRLQEKSGMKNNVDENQIHAIIKASKCSVFFVDEHQAITLKDIGTIANINYYAKSFEAEIYEYELKAQFRCNGSDNYLEFIDTLLYNKKNKVNYYFDFQVIDSPTELYQLIKEKNTHNNARLVAGFCWNRYSKQADNQDYHDIRIGDFSLSWNLKHGEEFAIRENAINEVGCIYNVQGLEFDYIGVIIGPDLKYANRKIITDYHARANTEKSLYGLQVLLKQDRETYEKLADTIIRNTYRVLLTRGMKGCYVYACDKKLQEHLKKIVNCHTIS